jgi:V/A-type H+/Na+-transporting ATPase subunit I
MRWRDTVVPVRMARVAVVAPADRLGDVLALVGTGDVELEGIAEEATVEEAAVTALRHGSAAALVGWSPRGSVTTLADRVETVGGAVAPLPLPPGVDPPTLVGRNGPTGVFQPLVDTYATMPYADLDPALFAGLAYVVMFGMMFGDVGHGALVTIGGLLMLAGRPPALGRLRHLAPFVIGGGLAAMGFGFAYGELFGPTHVVPTAWLAPLDHPTTLLAVAVAAGAGLLAVAYVLGTVNRFREGGAPAALLATSGLAGALVYVGLGAVGLGWYEHAEAGLAIGGAVAGCGLLLGYLGCAAGGGGPVQGLVELFDAVVRIVTNTFSFARLAAFGLTHAALGSIIWSGTAGLWHRGAAFWVPAAALFVVGNAVAIGLEGLVVGVQALRLDYYELFSRIFVGEGRPFRPWRPGAPTLASFSQPDPVTVPLTSLKEVPCSPG